MTTSTRSVTGQSRLVRRCREALSALGVLFLLGMAANLIGFPSENTGGARIIAGIVLGLHALVGVGVVVVAVRIWRAALDEGAGRREALWALVVVALTLLIGIGTGLTENGWLSFLMAVGFVVAAGLYIRIAIIAAAARAAV